ncbi:S-adenosyl-L-methionine-dependent methyltransferase [Dendryphion nanum]|uniref:S-adenosyl-L-methionine-dependent methyltransferase n=1 Tax=Dendryphion nanum TaxID=256645 RepID=A0A9P9IDS4_9PLEO|nr:S-adenosyl-L-methionine-dependent methyltransferase [Dendryphion nanum]
MPPPAWIVDNIPTLLRPSILLSMSIYHFFMTIYEVSIIEFQPWKLFELTALRFRAFARLWKDKGKEMSSEMPGNTFHLLAQCSGIVLDIGPGSGEMLSRFNSSQIAAIYGPEPAKDLHPSLLKNAEKAGFGNKYHALLCGAEPESLIPALHRSGILGRSGTGGTAEDGVFDEICCVRVLCGVPRPQETIRGLYALLKPGGRMVVCEHVVNPWRTEGSFLARFMQIVYTVLGWAFFMGGCELQRHTEKFLKEAGDWEQFELEYVGAQDAIPFVVGELIKKR